ncbi:MAG: Crp/Fnr family transcriptional regulator [Oscillospiraceae bacterium]|nr:Crp/Fnr family transcriptional regulator [Oscillospiraceae bacterium]
MTEFLQKCELFRNFPAEVIQQDILPQGKITELPKGQFFYEPQQQVDQISIVLSGKIHILHLFPDGSTSLTTVLTEGETLGSDLICTRSRMAPYHAVAAVPTKILSIPAELLLNPGMLEESCRLLALSRLLTMISHYNMKKEYRLAILSQKGLRERVMTYLSMQAGKRGTDTFKIPFTRDEMASFLCVNRSALSHELSLMEQEGLISFRKNVFTLLSPEKWKSQNAYEL